MGKVCWASLLVLIVVLSGMTYKFLFQGAAERSSDARLAIPLNADERNLVLAEMRVLLESVQQVASALSENDMARVAESARKAGLGAQQGVPGALMGKLPMDFKTLGYDTHAKFDELALDAEQLGDSGHTLAQLGVLMQNCVACHAAYRFTAELQDPAR